MLVATQFVLGNALLSWRYYNSLVVLGSFLAILALGQGTVILTGGLDLSLPWTIGFCGILCAGLLKGSDAALVYALPAALAVGALVGFVNGLGIVALGLSPIVMTLAMNGILQGVALVYSGGTPDGFASPGLRWFMTGQLAGITPGRVPHGAVRGRARWCCSGAPPLAGGSMPSATGSGRPSCPASRSSTTLVKVYVLSGLCAALVGCLLSGFSGQGSLGMGDEYLLPSIAVVVVGGALITGGRGSYIGMIGGVLLLTALQTLLAGTTLPYATRAILYGTVVLCAVSRCAKRTVEATAMNNITLAPNQRVLVTAGASGIGRAIADLLIDTAPGFMSATCPRLFLEDFRRAHPGHGTSVCDVSDEAQVERLFADVRGTLGGLDALINNAGIAGPTGGVENISPADWRRTIDICLTGQFLCTRLAVPMLKAAGGGAIVNMSSSAGRFGYAFRTPYSAAKWGVIGFTQSLAKELGPSNIRVNAILPGIITGPRMEGVIRDRAAQVGVPYATMETGAISTASRCGG